MGAERPPWLLSAVQRARQQRDPLPHLPAAWTRAEVYAAWLAMSAVGLTGWLLLVRGLPRTGLALLVVYAALGLGSLGHYLVAPLSAHSLAMNASILFEVAAAAILLIYLARLLSSGMFAKART